MKILPARSSLRKFSFVLVKDQARALDGERQRVTLPILGHGRTRTDLARDLNDWRRNRLRPRSW